MRYLRFTYQAEEYQSFMWSRQPTPHDLVGCHTWITPDDEYRDMSSDEGVKFRVNVVTKQGSPDLPSLDERIQDSLRKWSVVGPIELLGTEEITLEECVGAYSMRSRPLRDMARDLLAEEYFTVRMECDFINEYIVPERKSGEADAQPAPVYARALSCEVERIGEARPQAKEADDVARASFIPAHYLIEGMSQAEYRLWWTISSMLSVASEGCRRAASP